MPPKLQPCGNCKKKTPDGIQCDECKQWWCNECLNRQVEDMVPKPLYDALTAKKQFPWNCENCTDVNLLEQLVQKKVFTQEELAAYGCNPDILQSISAKSQAIPDGARTSQMEETVEKKPTRMEPQQPPEGTDTLAELMKIMLLTQQQSQQNFQQSQQNFQELFLEMRKDQKEELKMILEAVKPHQGAAAPLANTPISSPQLPAPSVVKLPKVQLPTFNGDLLEWSNFWESFEINVHSQTQLNNKQKLDYLHQVLKGAAYDKIKGLGLEGGSYEKAVQILQDYYGNPTQQEEACWKNLHSLPWVRENWSNLEKFTDEARALTVSLERKGIPAGTLDAYVPELKRKLPSRLKLEMDKMRLFQGRVKEKITMNEFLEFLQQFQKLQEDAAEGAKKKSIKEEPTQESQKPHIPTASFLQDATSQNYRKCVFCGKSNHFSDTCRKVTDIKQRRILVAKEKLCFNCLKQGHQLKECRRKKVCFYCKQEGHNSALCWKKQASQNSSPIMKVAQEESIKPNPIPLEGYLAGQRQNDGIVMAAFPCQTTNPISKESKELFIYLDAGARFTCINEKAASLLQLEPIKEVTLETSRFNTNEVEKVRAKEVRLELNGQKGFRLDVKAFTIPDMAPPLKIQPIYFDKEIWKKIQEFQPLNKPPKSPTTTPIDILIGMDYWYDIMGPSTRSIHLQGNLYIHQTPLGNIISGNSNTMASKNQLFHFQNLFCHAQPEDPVEQLWKLETIGLQPSEETGKIRENEISKRFKETIEFKQGRYEVRFPWKEKIPELPPNFRVAKHRLQSTLHSLAPFREPTPHYNIYNQTLQNQLQMGIIEPVTTKQADGPVVHYIPHFPVINEDKTTTKVRIVYDASAKTKLEKKSLNDLIYTGPCLLEDLIGMLIRFRLPKIALVSDVEKAFLQVGLNKEDRDCTRFLWLKDPTNIDIQDNIQVYRFTRIPFGIVASPYLLGATIQFHLDQNPGTVSEMIQQNIYMDNIILGAENCKEATEIYKTSKAIFQKASMNLREWQSNDPEFNAKLPIEDKMKGVNVKVLGLVWDTEKDTIQLKNKPLESPDLTKRSTLQELARVFDPLGIISPITIKGKLLQQEMWKKGLEWDEPLSDQMKSQWKSFEEDLQKILQVELPRRIVMEKNQPVQLLCFTDASPEAYAACVYTQQVLNDQVCCKLVFAKTRVAPIKPHMTLPQLELTSTLIGARSLRFVEKQLHHPVQEKFLWTDSQIALHWIHSKKELPSYVTRRTQEIIGNNDITFGYVNGKENPADHGTRGIPSQKFFTSNWLQGPLWTKKPKNQWPTWTPVPIEIPLLPQQKKMKSQVQQETHLQDIQHDTVQMPFEINLKKTNNIGKLLQITSYCQRFIQKCQKKPVPETKSVTTKEIQQAKISWIQAIQQQNFMEEIKLLQKGKKNQLIKQLDLFLDNNIIHCGGRLANAKMKKETRYPTLLPKNHMFTNLLIMEAHKKVFHSGLKATLAQLRLKYWIPHGYTQVRRMLKGCLICQRVQGGAFKPPKMAQLPPERVQRAPAFKFTGMDYVGPLLIKEKPGEDHQKRWIAIFTCLTTRAIHLELVKDCSAESATQAVLRFIGRRGTPHTILSDNALQFKKGAKILDTIWGKQPAEEIKETLTTFYASQGIQWKYIPENSPWVGGFYERLISLIKRAIKKTLWKATIDEDGLQTLIIQIEGILNIRPLLILGSELGEANTLTPADFISPISQLGVPPSDEDPNDPDYTPDPKTQEALLKQWNKIKKKLDQFWKVWQLQYLQELREAHSTYFKTQRGQQDRLPNIGEICLIKDTSPRVTWKMGKILNLIPAPDGETRFATIQLPSGYTTRRGIRDLVPLETNFTNPVEDNEVALLSYNPNAPWENVVSDKEKQDNRPTTEHKS